MKVFFFNFHIFLVIIYKYYNIHTRLNEILKVGLSSTRTGDLTRRGRDTRALSWSTRAQENTICKLRREVSIEINPERNLILSFEPLEI